MFSVSGFFHNGLKINTTEPHSKVNTIIIKMQRVITTLV